MSGNTGPMKFLAVVEVGLEAETRERRIAEAVETLTEGRTR